MMAVTTEAVADDVVLVVEPVMEQLVIVLHMVVQIVVVPSAKQPAVHRGTPVAVQDEVVEV